MNLPPSSSPTQRSALLLAGLLVFGVFSTAAQTPELSPAGKLVIRPLAAPSRSVETRIQFKAGHSFPIFSNGSLIERRIDLRTGTEKNISIYRPDSGQNAQFTLWIEGADRTSLTNLSLSDNNDIISTGFAARGTAATYFIRFSDSSAKDAIMVNTHAYLASAVCANPDGSVWTLGSRPRRVDGSYFGALRHYSRQGVVLDQALRTKNIGGEYSLASVDPRQVFLSCQNGDAYVYNNLSKTLSHFIASLSRTDTWTISGPSDMSGQMITGFATSADGSVFASFKQAVSGPHARRQLFRLVGTSARHAEWRPVPGTLNAGDPGGFWLLLGIEGKYLIDVTRPTPGHSESINWIPFD